MKFGIYVRSIGERTESLCIDSCSQYVDPKDIHILRNYFPSYKVYKEMFLNALKSDYEWFLAIDADVVLLPKWYKLVIKRIETVDSKNTFKFTFKVYDPIYDDLIDRGNHVYNNAHTRLALNALKKHIYISKLPKLFKRFFNPGYYLKPETSLRLRLLETHNLLNFSYPEVIGIHGAEQYFHEIFRTFLIRSKRNPGWIKKHDFLQRKSRQKLLEQNELDRYVANLGWHYGTNYDVDDIDARDSSVYKKVLKEFKVQERGKLKMTLGEFYEKYLRKIEGAY
jgi:hypothetical protein